MKNNFQNWLLYLWIFMILLLRADTHFVFSVIFALNFEPKRVCVSMQALRFLIDFMSAFWNDLTWKAIA